MIAVDIKDLCNSLLLYCGSTNLDVTLEQLLNFTHKKLYKPCK